MKDLLGKLFMFYVMMPMFLVMFWCIGMILVISTVLYGQWLCKATWGILRCMLTFKSIDT